MRGRISRLLALTRVFERLLENLTLPLSSRGLEETTEAKVIVEERSHVFLADPGNKRVVRKGV